MKTSFNYLNSLIQNDLDIYQISNKSNIEHKILRSFLNSFKLSCKFKHNTNYKKNFITPNDDNLFSPLSIIAHNLYLCEGWHTNKTNRLYFFNQDIKIIKIFCQCLTKIYNYSNIIPIFITYNKNDLQSINTVEHLKKEFNDNNVYKIYFINDSNRKNR